MVLGTEENIKKQEFFSCSCYSEGILVTDWKDPEDLDISLAIFSHGLIIPKRSLKERIKYSWKHLISGKIWDDEIILNPETADRLGKYLIERASDKKLIKNKI